MNMQKRTAILPYADQSIERKHDDLLSRLDGVKTLNNGKSLALCPSHPDRNPSLRITFTGDTLLLKCFAGCSVESILSAVGLSFSDIFPDRPKYHQDGYHNAEGYDRYQARKQIPRFSRYELFPKIVFESTILAVAIGDLLNGHSLDDAALERVQQSIDTITAVRMEVDV